MLTLLIDIAIKNKAIRKPISLSLLTTTLPMKEVTVMAEQSIPKTERVCQECGKKYYAKGYCERHYGQVRCYGKILKRTINDPNEIIIKGDIAEVVLYNNKTHEVARAIVDVEDVGKIKDYKWHTSSKNYAETWIEGKRALIQHVIMDIEQNKHKQIDHIDRDKLNNRKLNLRFCTQGENKRNGGIYKNNTSGFKGVGWREKRKKWEVRIGANRKVIFLGYFENKTDAVKAYNTAALKHHGAFACLNKI